MSQTSPETTHAKPCRKPFLRPAVVLTSALMLFAITSQATPIRESRIVGLSTGILGTVGASEGWTGGSGNYTVTNGTGSLIGTNLGLFASAGDMVNIASSGTLGQLNTYNTFTAENSTIPNTLPNKVYYSFLYRFNDFENMTDHTNAHKMFQANRRGSGTGIHFFMYCKTNAAGRYVMGVQLGTNGLPTDASAQIETNQTFFVVLRQNIVAGTANDVIDLWINPPSGSFGADELNVPAPDVSTSTGAEDTSTTGVGRFYVIAPGARANMDELRIATNSWADVTPPFGSCTAAAIDTNPTNATVSEGISASFFAFSSSSSPLYQWQRSTNAGATWHNVPDGIGDTSPTYTTAPLGTNANQNRFRCIVSVACGGGSSATSSVATVTVNAATPTPLGVVVDDTFADLSRTNGPVTVNNSIWYASAAASLSDGSSGNLIGTPAAGSSRLWIGYFTEDAAQPVHLAVGRALKTTLEFNATGIVVTNGGNSMRFGLFDYADGGTRVSADGFGSGSTGNGVNVRGYMFVTEFGTSYVANTPQSLYVRNLLSDANLMGSTGAYNSMGAGPDYATLNGVTAFTDSTPYTLVMTVARLSATNTLFTSTVIGGGTTNTTAYTDNTYAYPRYDAIAIRPNSAETTATTINITRFRAEVENAPVTTPTAIPLNVSASGGNVTLSWADPAFKLQAAPDVTGTYTNVTGAVSPHIVPASGSKSFYRLIWP